MIDGARREDEVVGVSQRVCRARAPLQSVCEPCAAAELAQVARAPELQRQRAVVRVGEIMIEARAEGVFAQGRVDGRDVRGEFGRLIGRGRGSFGAATGERGWLRERETRIGQHGQQRVNECRVEQRVVFVGDKDEAAGLGRIRAGCVVAAAQVKGAGEREAGTVLLQRQTF